MPFNKTDKIFDFLVYFSFCFIAFFTDLGQCNRGIILMEEGLSSHSILYRVAEPFLMKKKQIQPGKKTGSGSNH